LSRKIYILSGLGADESVFQKLDFTDLSITYIKWEIPYKDESIEHYAIRLLDQITTNKPILIGLSFGGIIAIEIAKLIETEKIIIIASAKTKKEIPFYYRWVGILRIHHLLPPQILKKSNIITNWFFGAKSAFDKQLLKEILLRTDTLFLKWAIDKVALWSNQIIPNTIIHIHGTSDRILPYRYIKSDIEVKNGGHFMTLNKHEELSKILRDHL
jgi:pimeloyl-ACP methyl ester carboxylesterase